MNQKINVGICPFLEVECIKERCHLYCEMTVMQVSNLAPAAKPLAMRSCVFILMLETLKMSLSKPPTSLTGGAR